MAEWNESSFFFCLDGNVFLIEMMQHTLKKKNPFAIIIQTKSHWFSFSVSCQTSEKVLDILLLCFIFSN